MVEIFAGHAGHIMWFWAERFNHVECAQQHDGEGLVRYHLTVSAEGGTGERLRTSEQLQGVPSNWRIPCACHAFAPRHASSLDG